VRDTSDNQQLEPVMVQAVGSMGMAPTHAFVADWKKSKPSGRW
jgi:hypothetical protein